MKIAADKIDGNRISLFCKYSESDACNNGDFVQQQKKIDVISTEHHSPSRKYIVFSYFIIIIMENHHFSEHQTVEAARTAEHCAVCVGSVSERIAVRQCLACSSFFPSHFLHSHSLRTSVQTHTLYLAPAFSVSSRVYFPFVIRWCVVVFIVAIVVVLTAAFMSLSLSLHSLMFPFIHADFCITLWIQLSPHHCSRCQWIVTSRLLHDYQEIFSYTNTPASPSKHT